MATLDDHLPTARPRHYPSDTTDAEWQILAPHVPAGTGRSQLAQHPPAMTGRLGTPP